MSRKSRFHIETLNNREFEEECGVSEGEALLVSDRRWYPWPPSAPQNMSRPAASALATTHYTRDSQTLPRISRSVKPMYVYLSFSFTLPLPLPLSVFEAGSYTVQAGFEFAMDLNSDLPASTFQILGL